jgi:cell shape-determining protein MreC
MLKNNSQFILFIASILLILIIYFLVDIFYLDLPPYSISLKEVNSYIYFNDKINIAVYSLLTYKSNFLISTSFKRKQNKS